MLMSQKENVQCDIKVDCDRHEEMEVDGKEKERGDREIMREAERESEREKERGRKKEKEFF